MSSVIKRLRQNQTEHERQAASQVAINTVLWSIVSKKKDGVMEVSRSELDGLPSNSGLIANYNPTTDKIEIRAVLQQGKIVMPGTQIINPN